MDNTKSNEGPFTNNCCRSPIEWFDAMAEQCGSAAYQPFSELSALIRKLATGSRL
jgi:hypothetical protein